MRQSRQDAARTRQRIVKTAARQFRKHGIDGISVADVMAKAGLTHGGFYKHFASKQALATEALRWALAAGREDLAAVAEAAPRGKRLKALVEAYLSMAHRDSTEQGCAIAALSSGAARLDMPARQAINEGFEALATLVATQFAGSNDRSSLERARVLLATMVGALTISRTIDDRKLAEELLRSTRDAVLAQD